MASPGRGWQGAAGDGAVNLRLPIAKHNWPTLKRPASLVPRGSGRSCWLGTPSTFTTAKSAGTQGRPNQQPTVATVAAHLLLVLLMLCWTGHIGPHFKTH
jgi:hypothetical protein